jgi:hypothetical protein
VAADPQTGIITDKKLTRGGAGTRNSDPAVTQEFLAAGTGAGDDVAGSPGDLAGEPCPGEPGTRDSDGNKLSWYGDTAYGTGELRKAIGKAGHRVVIKPKPVQPAVPCGFTADDFTVDEHNGTVTCPAGVTRRIPPGRHVVFDAASHTCPLHHVQVRAGPQPDPHDRLLRAARANWAADPGLRQDYMAHRCHVERAVAQVATWRARHIIARQIATDSYQLAV